MATSLMDQILEDGIILRARQQDASKYFELMGKSKEGPLFNDYYSQAMSNIRKLQRIIGKYPDCVKPKEIFNQMIDCMNIYGVRKCFEELKKMSLK